MAHDSFLRRWGWEIARRVHHWDFACVLPALARLPIPLGHWLARVRGELNAMLGRDWRSMALGFRHLRRQCAIAYRELRPDAPPADIEAWTRGRFVAEARDEYESRLAAGGRVDDLECEIAGPGDARQLLAGRSRGLVLVTAHFESFFLGIAFLGRATGATINSMSSSVTQDPRVDPAVQRHFDDKYRGLERYLNGGKVPDHEKTPPREFYRMLGRGEVLVIIGDAPVLPDGAEMVVPFAGGTRRLAGGALRLARATGSDIGAFVCRHLGGRRYRIEMSAIGPAEDPQTVAACYRFLGDAIEADPGGWWASDLLTAMPLAPAAPKTIQVLLLTDSTLAGCDELACGVAMLREALGTANNVVGWHERAIGERAPADDLRDCRADRLLVLLHPALLAAPSLADELAGCLDASAAACAVAADPRDAAGEWCPAYTTRADFEAYVARRAALPVALPLAPAPADRVAWAFMVDAAQAAEVLRADETLAWEDVPARFGARAVRAPRAFVHSYAGYQQLARGEMLELLPGDVRTLLDVGGGEGGFARAFVEARGGKAWLVEPSAAADRAARHPGLHVMRGRIEDLDAALDGHFDAVSLLDVLEHVAEPAAMLARARRLLRPNGWLLLSVPNIGHWSVVRDLAQGRFDYLPVGVLCTTHVRFFTARSLRELLEREGFEVERCESAGPALPPEFADFAAAAERIGLPIDRASLAAETWHVLARLR
ncbi:MAG TPA: methyltransferase domain-containing protein [Ramlibacter sp.]|uniref:methyltransferase domain-containing protein n=1 Tax=Ramlibacter sp. TaxID=1917967 RepID=UPI002C89745E|nr:methyltransferase domain-containing protein [Ramlibacter sp.]HVZ46404.1 methyltransferase domain-containing protein [Ramlibacter sp.]